MCTVTFIPVQGKVLLTSNRDEKGVRKKATAPTIYTIDQTKVLFPQDAQAGGTWIGTSETGTVMVLLNGGFIKHEPAATYRKSRGLIFLDILSQQNTLTAYRKINLLGIEPFTLIIWEEDHLYECRWSGEEKYIREVDATQPHIWSSVTLYTQDIIQKREYWFTEWLKQHPHPSSEDILSFHLFGGNEDLENGIRMNRNNEMLTVSVTNIVCNHQSATMFYNDIIHQEQHQLSLSFVQQQPVS
jgi:hypothetical protein